MSVTALLAIALGIQLFFCLIDLVDRHLTRDRRYDGEPLKPRTMVFLVVVLSLYFLVQYAGFALVPDTDTLLVTIGTRWAELLGRPSGTGTISGPWLWALVAAAFYLSGLWDYLMHRFASHSRWLWFTHEYHHLPNQVFVGMPGVAARPFSVVTTFPVAVGTIVCAYAILVGFGQPLWDLGPLKVLVLLHMFVLTASHSCCLRRWWWVHRVMTCAGLTTPHEHVLHHAVGMKGNYGNFTTLWDRLFGTYLEPTRITDERLVLGLGYDQDFLGAVTAGRLKLPARVRAYFQVDRYCNTAPGPPSTGRMSEAEEFGAAAADTRR